MANGAPIDTINLKEVTVQSKDIRIDSGKIIITPSSSAKKLAKDMKSLVEITNSGLFTIVDGKITVNGQPVTLAINGETVDQIDEKTFWAKNVLRLEYIENPDDQALSGQQRVLNFVMKEYLVGGLTRLDGSQYIPNNGDYFVSSKLVYKPITLNAFGQYDYSNLKNEGYDIAEEYRDVWYSGEKYPEIFQNDEMTTHRKSHNYSFGLNLRQKGSKFSSVHSASFYTSHNKNNIYGETSIMPGLIGGDSQRTCSDSKNKGFTIKGEYKFLPSKKFGVFVDWNISRNFNNSDQLYDIPEYSEIVTDISERTFGAFFKARVAFKPHKNSLINLSVSEKYSKFKADYSGNTISSQLQKYYITDLTGSFTWFPNSNFDLRLAPTVSILKKEFNNTYNNTEVLPSAEFTIRYGINSRSQIGTTLFYSLTPPAANSLNDLVLQQDILKWLKGNPSLKPKQTYSLYVEYFCIPSRWLTYIARFNAYIITNQSVISYMQGGKDYNGVIGEYVNGLNEERYSILQSFSFKLFNNSLKLAPVFDMSYYRVKGIDNLFWFNTRLDATFFYKDLMVTAMCSAPDKMLLQAGNETIKSDWRYNIGVSYALGNLIFGARLDNIFNKHNTTKSYYRSPYYDFTRTSFGRGRCFNLSVTYTFDYGKKVDRSIDIDTGHSGESSILTK